MSDSDTTKAQGTAVGAVLGAVVGAGLGALTGLAVGGRTEDIVAGAVIGGGAGGMAGGVAGYQYGMRVAERKAYYRDSEEFYLAEIQQIDESTKSIKRVNVQLAQAVGNLERRKAVLNQALAAGQIDRRSYEREIGAVRRQARYLRREVQPAGRLIGYQRALVRDASESGVSPDVANELARSARDQEDAYAPLKESLSRLSEVERPTRG